MDAKRRQSILKVKDENEKVQEEKDGVNRRVSFANTKLIKTYHEDMSCSTVWHSTMEESTNSMSLTNSSKIQDCDMSLTQNLGKITNNNQTISSPKDLSFTQNLGKINKNDQSSQSTSDLSLTQEVEKLREDTVRVDSRDFKNMSFTRDLDKFDETHYITNTSCPELCQSQISVDDMSIATKGIEENLPAHIKSVTNAQLRSLESDASTSVSSLASSSTNDTKTKKSSDLLIEVDSIIEYAQKSVDDVLAQYDQIDEIFADINFDELLAPPDLSYQPPNIEFSVEDLPKVDKLDKKKIEAKRQKLLEIVAEQETVLKTLMENQPVLQKKKSLDVLLEEGRERWDIFVIVKRLTDEKYEIWTLYKSIKLLVNLNGVVVQSFEISSVFTKNAKPIGRYINGLFRHRFTPEILSKALGEKYDLISFIDYAHQLLEQCSSMLEIYEKLYVSYNLTINNEFEFEFVVNTGGREYAKWVINGNLSNDNVIPIDSIRASILSGPDMDLEKIKKLLLKTNEEMKISCMHVLNDFIKSVKMYQININGTLQQLLEMLERK